MKQLKSIYRATFFATALVVVTGLAACGGGGSGGGSANTFTASCSDGTTKTSSVSQADAQSQCSTASTALSTNTPTANYSLTEKLNVFNQLNLDRLRCGFGSLQQNTKLDNASQAHASYLATNNAEGHTEIAGYQGFTGASEQDRLIAAGYSYSSGNEVAPGIAYGTWYSNSVIPNSATEVTGRNVLRSTYSTVYHLVGLMSGNRETGVGIAIANNSAGGSTAFVKYLVMDSATASGQVQQQIAQGEMASFPCDGTTGLNPYFANESPNPFPSVTLTQTPYGTPVYLMSATGTTLTVTSATITQRGVGSVPLTQLNTSNDPQSTGSLIRLTANQVFIVPTTHLANNATYDVVLVGTNTGLVTTANPTGNFTRSFSFQTGTYTSD